MLDKKTDAVLELISEKAGNSYKILNKRDLLNELPSKLEVDESAFAAIIAFLKDNEYVDVKYQDKDEICIAATVKAESYAEGEKNIQQKAKITNGQLGFLVTIMFLASFLGAFIATLIGKLIP